MNKVYLLIGGNMGDRRASLSGTINYIEQLAGTIMEMSSVYETAAWGYTQQPAFLNQALFIDTELSPGDLLEKLLAIEERMGRKRIEKYGPRIIDIDILFYNDAVIRLPQLTIPHPEIQNRRFVLTPMNEIAASFVHPLLGKTINRLLADCKDELEVNLV